MKEKTKFTSAESELRHRAEVQLGRKLAKSPPPATEADTTRLLHELQVHQIELELQNAELQEARDKAESLLETYTELYDFAPVGYFSIDETGMIVEVNLTGAALLGVARSRLINQPLQRFVDPPSRKLLQAFLKQIFENPKRHICELPLLGRSTGCLRRLHKRLSKMVPNCHLRPHDPQTRAGGSTTPGSHDSVQ